MSIFFCKSIFAFVMGAFMILALSFSVYRKSYYYKKADLEMRGLTEKPKIISRLITLMILFAMILFFTVVDLWISSGEGRSFVFLSVYNLLLVLLLSLFDALFIDYYLLVIWRPALLRLPEGQPTRNSMLRHIKKQFTGGWLFKVPIALLSAVFSTVLYAGFS